APAAPPWEVRDDDHVRFTLAFVEKLGARAGVDRLGFVLAAAARGDGQQAQDRRSCPPHPRMIRADSRIGQLRSPRSTGLRTVLCVPGVCGTPPWRSSAPGRAAAQRVSRRPSVAVVAERGFDSHAHVSPRRARAPGSVETTVAQWPLAGTPLAVTWA